MLRPQGYLLQGLLSPLTPQDSQTPASQPACLAPQAVLPQEAAPQNGCPVTQDKIEEYRATVTAQMTPVVNLVKVLTTQHDESFVQLYCATLPHEWQNATEMTRLLAVLDLRPDQRDARMLSFSMHAVPEVSPPASPTQHVRRGTVQRHARPCLTGSVA